MADASTHPDRRDFLRLALAASALGHRGPAPASSAGPARASEAQDFLKGYDVGWLPLETAGNNAAWVAATDVSEAHTAAQVAANQAVSDFVGSTRVIETTRDLLGKKGDLDDLTVRQLEKVRLRAAEAPATVPDAVKARIKAEADQSAAQDGFAYTLKPPNGKLPRNTPRPTPSTACSSTRSTSTSAATTGRRPRRVEAPCSARPACSGFPRPPEQGGAGGSASSRSSRSRSPTTG